jgi:hypothetical protein
LPAATDLIFRFVPPAPAVHGNQSASLFSH